MTGIGLLRGASEGWCEIPRFATGRVPILWPQIGRWRRREAAAGRRSARVGLPGGRHRDDDLVGTQHVERLADLRFEQVRIDLIGAHMRDAMLHLDAFFGHGGELLLRLPQLLGHAYPSAQPSIALDEVIAEIPRQQNAQGRPGQRPRALAYFAHYDHPERKTRALAPVNAAEGKSPIRARPATNRSHPFSKAEPMAPFAEYRKAH